MHDNPQQLFPAPTQDERLAALNETKELLENDKAGLDKEGKIVSLDEEPSAVPIRSRLSRNRSLLPLVYALGTEAIASSNFGFGRHFSDRTSAKAERENPRREKTEADLAKQREAEQKRHEKAAKKNRQRQASLSKTSKLI